MPSISNGAEGAPDTAKKRPISMSRSTFPMYAELLVNIRQISIIATLDTPSNSATKLELSKDGAQAILHHDGHATSLYLPGQVSSYAQLQNPILGRKELSWRLPLTEQPKSPSGESNDAPWPAKDLDENSEFRCRGCDEIIVGRGRIRTWKDLPSENWAEMMDFWHCHKPDGPNSHGDHLYAEDNQDMTMTRGYGANAKFTAQPRIGFVDLTTVLLAESDCKEVERKESPRGASQYQILICKNCRNYLGHVDQYAEGYRFYKWRLESTTAPLAQEFPYYRPSTASFISAQLQSITLAQCSSRFLLAPMTWKPPPSNPAKLDLQEVSKNFEKLEIQSSELCILSLWVLNPTLRYTTASSQQSVSESPGSPSGIPAMKIFWKAITLTEANTLANEESVELVSIPEETISEIEETLQQSAQFLPPSSRTFKCWDVGLLERYEADD